MSGRPRSRITTSGECSTARRTAPAPSPASHTACPCTSSTVRSISRRVPIVLHDQQPTRAGIARSPRAFSLRARWPGAAGGSRIRFPCRHRRCAALIVPPCSSTRFLASESPIPCPPCACERSADSIWPNMSKIRVDVLLGGMPMPDPSPRDASASVSARHGDRAAGGVNFTALISKLRHTRPGASSPPSTTRRLSGRSCPAARSAAGPRSSRPRRGPHDSRDPGAPRP